MQDHRHDCGDEQDAGDREQDRAPDDSLQVGKVEPEGGLEHQAGNEGGQDDIRGDREARRRHRRDQEAEGHEGDAQREPHPPDDERDERECAEQGNDDLNGAANVGIRHVTNATCAALRDPRRVTVPRAPRLNGQR